MRAVVQRVLEARVEVAGDVVAQMQAGLLVLLGVGQDDTPEQAQQLARKIVHLRIFEDAQGRMNRSLLEEGGTLGVVSQFTLYGDARKGRRPSFGAAAAPEQASPLVDEVVEAARSLGASVVTGQFRAHMRVHLVNDGPVTLWLDTENLS
ncbi:MAG: D-aminoacyl-tRNA deacylase [Myxococcota bacterium]|nr:D-aminoacyl-tRNA deacylase [Myxococcota bacterium]